MLVRIVSATANSTVSPGLTTSSARWPSSSTVSSSAFLSSDGITVLAGAAR